MLRRATPSERLPFDLMFVAEGAQSAWTLQETYCNQPVMREMRLGALNVCLTGTQLK